MTATFTLQPQGPFSLAAASAFGRGFKPSPLGGTDDATAVSLHLAFPCASADWQPVGVHVRAGQNGNILGTVTTAAGPVPSQLVAAVAQETARVFSLDVDGRAFAQLGDNDQVVRSLQQRYDGLRPVLFYSPYEAAAWTLFSRRVRITQAAALRNRFQTEHGSAVPVNGQPQTAFPSPEQLLTVPSFPGVSAQKIDWLHELARAALNGDLDPGALRAADPQEALQQLQRLPGIGPFSAELILIRGAGAPDLFPVQERRVEEAVRLAYNLPEASLDDLRDLAQTWRPYRSWVCVLLRKWLEDETGDIRRGRRSLVRPGPLTD